MKNYNISIKKEGKKKRVRYDGVLAETIKRRKKIKSKGKGFSDYIAGEFDKTKQSKRNFDDIYGF